MRAPWRCRGQCPHWITTNYKLQITNYKLKSNHPRSGYHNYSLFISNAASLFTVCLSLRIGAVHAQTATAGASPRPIPCPERHRRAAACCRRGSRILLGTRSPSPCRPGMRHSYRYNIMKHKKSSPVKGRKASNIHSFNITIHDFQQKGKLSVSQCMARIGKNSRPVLGPCTK